MKTRTILNIVITCGIVWTELNRDARAETATTANDSGDKTTEVSVQSSGGNLTGLKVRVPVVGPFRTNHVSIVYLPDTGNVWTGFQVDQRVLLDGRFFGFRYAADSMRLTISMFTNRYEPHQEDLSAIIRTEVERYKTEPGRLSGFPEYVATIGEMIPPRVLHDRLDPNRAVLGDHPIMGVLGDGSGNTYSVEGTNMVVAIRFGTNALGRIAFEREVRPVWATTNGVSVGPIPTNTVYYTRVKPIGGRRIELVY